MPQFLLSVCFDGDYDEMFDEADAERQTVAVGAVNEEMVAAGVRVFVAGLAPPSQAAVVDGAGGTVSMTDGPYAETKEQMGGFWVLEVDDRDAALAWAAKATAACERPIEVRAVDGPG